METLRSLPIAIIGAGPVGLAAAAHLSVRNQRFILFEAGATVASNVLSWKHVLVFSPWRYNIDKVARQLLEESGWERPDDEALPTGEELYNQYFKPFSELPSIRPYISLGSNVVSIGRKGLDKMKTSGRDDLPFVVQVMGGGGMEYHEVKGVIDASGTWHCPNPIGAGGTYAAGEAANADRIFYGIPDISGVHAERYGNKRILVVGSGHSSIHVILALGALRDRYPETVIDWVLRKRDVRAVYGGQGNDALAARGVLGIKIEAMVNDGRVRIHTSFHIQQIAKDGGRLAITGWQDDGLVTLHGIDEVISNTGSRPDLAFLRELRLNIDASLESVAGLADLIDPNIHSCGTVRPHGEQALRHPDTGFYIAGSKSYGRAPTFLMATGYEQVRSIAAFIDGDFEAARAVELDLPETGVCSAGGVGAATTSTCCTPKEGAVVCCEPSKSREDNNGACCPQPLDGSTCCNK